MTAGATVGERYCQRGCRPECKSCGRVKAPRGRSVPAAMYGGLCTPDSCMEYADKPSPCDLWPGEEREQPATPPPGTGDTSEKEG